MIKLNTDFLWKPDPSKRGLPAVEMPPNAHFDVYFDLTSEEDDILQTAWQEMPRKVAKNREHKNSRVEQKGLAPFPDQVKLLEKFKVLYVCPQLYTIREEDDEVADLVGSFNIQDAQRLYHNGQALKGPPLWQYMSQLIESAASKLCWRLLAETREASAHQRGGLNVYGKPKRCSPLRAKPFTTAVRLMAIKWHIEHSL